MQTNRKTKLLAFGGGSGQYALLSGLRDFSHLKITSVVSMVDSGGSTGRLRDEFGTLPPGDVLKCILALSPYREIARRILLKRFAKGGRLQDHNAGNMLLTMLSRYAGSFSEAIAGLSEILDVNGTILPVTVDRATLVAELTNGSHVYGENAIDVPRGDQREKIKKVFLVPHHTESLTAFPPVLENIATADVIVIGPGDLFTSIMPGLIVPGISAAIAASKAPVVYVINIMTKFGETHNFTGRDFVDKIEEGIGRQVDAILYNTTKPGRDLMARYRKQRAAFVEIDGNDGFWQARHLIQTDLLDTSGGIVRHDSEKLVHHLDQIIASLPESAFDPV